MSRARREQPLETDAVHIDLRPLRVPSAVLSPALATIDIPRAPFADESTFGDPEGWLVVHLGPPCRFTGDSPRPTGTAYVLGPRTAPFGLHVSTTIETIMVRLAAPDLSRLLGLEPAEVLGRAFPLDDARPDLARAIEARLTPDLRASGGAVAAWVEAQLRRSRPADARAREALRVLQRTGGAMSVDALARHLGLHARTLERLFRRHIGASPKLTASLIRTRVAIRALGGGGSRASDVAVDVGFADQAHMIRNIRRFTGCTPGELFRRPRLGLVSLVTPPPAAATVGAPEGSAPLR